MKKRLLIFHPTIAPYRIDFFNSLYKAFDTRICLRYRNLKSQKFDYNKIASEFIFEPIYLKESFKFIGKQMYKGIWKQLDDFKPDIVIAEEFSIYTVIIILHRLLKRRKYKIVSICDDSYNMVAENNDFSKAHRIARKLVVPCLDNLILVEPKVSSFYKEKYGKGIYFPIIKDDKKIRLLYKSILSQSQNTAEKYNLIGKKIFLYVGRLVNIKNIKIAIESFANLNQEENTFVIIGDGPMKQEFEEVAQKLETNTIFTGRLEGEELNQWYNIAQVFILPSYQEAFGAVTNEALLAGCKALISEKAGSQCLIENGINGYTINPLDKADIVNKMDIISKEIVPLEKVVLKKNLMKEKFDVMKQRLIDELYNL